jgi:hypothetical protein
MADRTYSVTIEGNAGPYVRAVDQATSRTTHFADQAESAGQRASTGFSRSAIAGDLFSGSIARAGEAAAGFFSAELFLEGGRKAVEGIKGIVEAGISLTETVNRGKVTFGESFAFVSAGADEMARKFGIDKVAFIDAASGIGQIGKAAGQSQFDAAQMGASMAKLGAEVASLTKTPLPDVLGAIQSGLVGQGRALLQYGVRVDAVHTQEEALRLGLITTGQTLTEQQALQARASLITQGLGYATGNLAKTQEDLGSRIRTVTGDVKNWAADLGQRAQPALLGVLNAGQRFASEGLDVIRSGLAQVQPFFRGLEETASNLGPIFRAGEAAALPFVEVLATIAGLGISTALNAIGSGLSAVSGFLAHNEQVVRVLASAYIASLVPAMLTAAKAFGGVVLNTVADGYLRVAAAVSALVATYRGGMTPAVESSTGQLSLFATTEEAVTVQTGVLAGVLNLAKAAFLAVVPVAAIFAISTAISAFDNARAQAKAFVDQVKEGKNLQTEAGLQDYITDLNNQGVAAQEASNKNRGLLGSLKGTLEVFSPLKNTVADADARFGALASEFDNAQGKLATLRSNVDRTTSATGLNKDAVVQLAQKLGIDLTTAGNSAIGTLIAAANAARGAGQVIGSSLLELTDAEKAIGSAVSAAVQPGNVVSAVVTQQNEMTKAAEAGTKAADKQGKTALQVEQAQLSVQRATESLTAAEQHLADLRSSDRFVRAAEDAEFKLQEAYDRVQRSIFGVLDATRALEDARRAQNEARNLTEAEFAAARAGDAHAQSVQDQATAELKLAAAQDHGTPDELAQSERELAEARRRVTETSFGAEDATVALTRAQQDQADGGRAVAEAQLGVNAASREATLAQRNQVDSQKALNDLLAGTGPFFDEIHTAELAVRDAAASLAAALDSANQKLDTLGSTAAGPAAKAFDAGKVSLQQFTAEFANQIKAASDWEANLVTIAQRGGTAVATEFQKMGIGASKSIADIAHSSDVDFNRAADLAIAAAIRETSQYTLIISAGLGDASAKAKIGGSDVAQSIADSLGLKRDDVVRIMNQYMGNVIGPLNALNIGIGKPLIPAGAIKANYPPGTFGPFLAAAGAVMSPYGSEDHVAQIARPGEWRVWAEDETGGESYIPWAQAKRDRASQVLKVTANAFGFELVPTGDGPSLRHFAGGGVQVPSPPDLIGPFGQWLGAQGQNDVNYAHDAAQAFIDSRSVAAAPSSGGAVAAGPVPPGAPRDWILAGLAAAGVDPGWLPGMYRLGQAESGLDPHSYNKTPVGSEHAEGFMQMLPSTFRAHMVPGHPDIWNPIDNVASSAGYIVGRYGTVYNTPLFKGGPYAGYGSGGIHVGTFDQGGWLMPGITVAGNFTGRPEPVGGAGGISITFHVQQDIKVGSVGDLDALGKTVQEATERALGDNASQIVQEANRR